MTSPRVSVCIRTLDRPGPLRDAISSVLAQEFGDLEVIVSSDGASVDDLVAEFGDDRVRAVQPAGPPSATGNLLFAFGLARGEILALLDDDDRWEPQFLARLLPAFDADPSVGVVFCDFAMVTEQTSFERRWPWASGNQGDLLVRLLDRSIPPAAALLRHSAWLDGEQRLPLQPDMAGAATIWLRAAEQGWAFHHVPRTLVEYRMHPGQMSWAASTVTARWARTLEQLSFTDPAAERVRRARLAEAHCTQAGIYLRDRKLRRSCAEVRAARRHGPVIGVRNLIALSGLRRLAARQLPAHPRLLAALLPLWQRLRPAPG